MSIVRTEHNKSNPYVMLNKSVLEDPKLSWQAKGLWAYLISRPDNWKVSVAHLSTIYKGKGGGEKGIYSLLNELIEHSYCYRFQTKGDKGHFNNSEYVITEFKKCLPDSPQRDAAPVHAVKGGTNKEGAIPSTDVQEGAIASEEISPEAPLPEEEQKKKEACEILQLYCSSNSLSVSMETLRRWYSKWGEDRTARNLSLLAERMKFQAIENHERWMERSLKDDFGQQSQNEKINRENFITFMEKYPYLPVKVTKKYIVHKIYGIEIYFKQDPKQFAEQIRGLNRK